MDVLCHFLVLEKERISELREKEILSIILGVHTKTI